MGVIAHYIEVMKLIPLFGCVGRNCNCSKHVKVNPGLAWIVIIHCKLKNCYVTFQFAVWLYFRFIHYYIEAEPQPL